MLKLGTYGAFIGALVMIMGAESAQAAARHRHRERDHGRTYAQSFYDYRSASRVTESFFQDDGFRVAPEAPMPPAAYYPPPRSDGDYRSFNGGVGYGASVYGGGYGGGYGGIVTLPNNGYGNPPPNRGGVNLPPGYGPDYRGNWQGPPMPSRGGLRTRNR